MEPTGSTDWPFLHRIATAVAEAPAPGGTVIYFAIGCAQGHYAPGAHSAQQYPPFLASWHPATARQLVILVDPALEDPPRALLELPPAPTPPNPDLDALQFYMVRAPFYWTNPHYRRYMAGLIRIVLAAPRPTYLIVQDYTGHDLQEDYTSLLHNEFRTDHRLFLHRVLFDPSYDGPGCFQPLTVPLLRHPATGDFLQPAYIPLQRLRHCQPPVPPAILRHHTEIRSAAIRYYAYRLLRTLRGQAEPSPHATSEIVREKLQFFGPIYGYAPTAHPTVLRNLIADTLRDFAALLGDQTRYTDEAIDAILADPRGNALNTEFHTLRQRILGTLE
jgi:hypothetical protein